VHAITGAARLAGSKSKPQRLARPGLQQIRHPPLRECCSGFPGAAARCESSTNRRNATRLAHWPARTADANALGMVTCPLLVSSWVAASAESSTLAPGLGIDLGKGDRWWDAPNGQMPCLVQPRAGSSVLLEAPAIGPPGCSFISSTRCNGSGGGGLEFRDENADRMLAPMCSRMDEQSRNQLLSDLWPGGDPHPPAEGTGEAPTFMVKVKPPAKGAQGNGWDSGRRPFWKAASGACAGVNAWPMAPGRSRPPHNAARFG